MVAGPEPCVRKITLPDSVMPITYKTETDDHKVTFEENDEGRFWTIEEKEKKDDSFGG